MYYVLSDMSLLTAEAIWNLNQTELERLLDSGTLQPKSRSIHFYAPSFTYYKTKHYRNTTTDFPTISLTGNQCALNCKHCNKKVLETMQPATSPDTLFSLGLKLKETGAKGCLVSGGCLPDGSLPLDGFAGVLGRFKRELGLTVFVHTGIIRPKTACALKKAGVDAALIDVVGSRQTAQRVYNLSITTQDYAQSLKALYEAKLNVVPHVIVGLADGRLEGELEALKMIGKIKPAAIVIIAFMPIAGTEMAKTSPPKPLDIAKVVASARVMFPQTPLLLGCMRPKGRSRAETDVWALKAGVDGVAFPSEAAIEFAQGRGEVCFSSFCCAQMHRDFER